MEQILGTLSPEAILVVGILWILREIFGFLGRFMDKNTRRNGDLEVRQILDTLKKVADHIEAQTDLVKDLSREHKSLRQDVDRLKEDIRLRDGL